MKTEPAYHAKRAIEDTELYTWFERDRAHVELRDLWTDSTIVEWWDEAVKEAVEDGYLNPKNYKRSAYEYAKMHGMLADCCPDCGAPGELKGHMECNYPQDES